jgi:hypothetical protein
MKKIKIVMIFLAGLFLLFVLLVTVGAYMASRQRSKDDLQKKYGDQQYRQVPR